MESAQGKPVVLVVDDAEEIHMLLRARLRVEGLETRSAYTGAECLRAAAEGPALILLDIDMPGMDGFETLRALKHDPVTGGIPVIVLSGSTESNDKVTGLDLGAVDYVCKPFDFYELIARVRAALRTQRLVEMLAKRAQIDGLTGLWNRAHFDARMVEALANADRRGERLSLALADLDRFKSVNDSYGHPAGDAALQGFAELLQQSTRKSDVAFRFGGEEFALLLPNTGGGQAVELVERIRTRFQAMRWPRHPERPLTASFGVVWGTGCAGGLSAAGWVEAADRALYQAKSGGRNRAVVTCLDPGMDVARAG